MSALRSEAVGSLEHAALNDLRAFEHLGTEWDALVATSRRPSPFFLHGWLVEWWRHFRGDSDVSIETVRSGGRLVGALPLERATRRTTTVTSFLGGRVSKLGDLLLAADRADVSEMLIERLRSGGDVVDLVGLPAGSRVALECGDELALLDRTPTPVLHMPDGWEAAYCARTSAKRRGMHRRAFEKLSKLGRVNFHVAKSPGDLEHALTEAYRLHDLRWSDRGDTSLFGTAPGREFHAAATTRLAASDVARIVSLTLDGRAIAFAYYFQLAGALYLYRLAFDPEFAQFSPGLLTTYKAFDTACSDGATRLELMAGASQYKLSIADQIDWIEHRIGMPTSLGGSSYRKLTTVTAALRRRLRAIHARA